MLYAYFLARSERYFAAEVWMFMYLKKERNTLTRPRGQMMCSELHIDTRCFCSSEDSRQASIVVVTHKQWRERKSA